MTDLDTKACATERVHETEDGRFFVATDYAPGGYVLLTKEDIGALAKLAGFIVSKPVAAIPRDTCSGMAGSCILPMRHVGHCKSA